LPDAKDEVALDGHDHDRVRVLDQRDLHAP
jgi:hypothetical protein